MSRKKQTYQLIKGLSQGEKRFFTLYMSKYSKKKNNNITQLCDIYDSNTEWNEQNIKKSLKKEKLDGFTSVLNNRLLDKLITGLRIQSTDNIIDLSINRFVEEARILFQREIFELAIDKIRKAKNLAYSSEKYDKLLEICSVEKLILVRVVNNQQFREFCIKSSKEIDEIIKSIVNKNAYRELSDEMFYLYRKLGIPKNNEEKSQLKNLTNHPLLKNIKRAKSISAKSSFYFIYTIYYLSIQEKKKALNTIDNHLKIIEANNQYFRNNLDQCLAVLNNALFIHSENNDKIALFETIDKIRKLQTVHKIENTYFNRLIFETTYSMELDYYIKNDELKAAKNLVPEIIRELKKYRKYGWSLDRFLTMAFGISLVYFYDNNIEESHIWIDKILEYENKNSNLQILSFAKILDLILHYQRHNKSLLLYRSKSVTRYLKKNNTLHEIDKGLIKMLHQLSDNKNPKKYVTIFLNLFARSENSYTKMYYLHYIKIEALCTALENKKQLKIKQ